MTCPHPVLLERQRLGGEKVDVPLRHHAEGMQRLRLILQETHVLHLIPHEREETRLRARVLYRLG